MDKRNLEVEMWETEKVVPYESNPRRLPEVAIEKVAASIKEFGWRQPIVVDKKGVVVVGHTRLEAAKRLGSSKVPVHVARDLSARQAKAYRIADNRVGEETSWDRDALASEISALAENADLLDAVGFDAVDLAEFLGEAPEVDELDFADAGESRLDRIDGMAECPQCGHVWRP
jgi:ParB-like chromosome segregation protein Spo0J